MRRFAFLVVLLFVCWAPAAGATTSVTVQASLTSGQAPLEVTLTATGDAVSYHWALGDGATADGPVVQHRYARGRYTATVTGAGADGTTAQASVRITAFELRLSGPRAGTYGRRTIFKGRLLPATRNALVSLYANETLGRTVKTDRKGRFRFRLRPRSPATFSARFESVVSNPVSTTLRPGLDIALPRSAVIGHRLRLRAGLRPRRAGTLRVRIWRSGRELPSRTFGGRAVVILSTARAADYAVRIEVTPSGAFLARRTTVHTSVYLPYLSLGSQGPSVRILERRLAELRYTLRGVDTYYAHDTYDAVLAFQKVHGLARTGRADPAFWRRLRTAHVPRPRYRRGHHLEIDKSRQVLFEVGGGRVVRVVHVSTGATGNTPAGRWRVYSKVVGWSWVLWYPMYFLRGFAIHGYPSVPPYPASHGCVRTPMWIAPTLFATNSYGESVYVYY
jgi:N-acetylmuramoyl-L-alanine amidase